MISVVVEAVLTGAGFAMGAVLVTAVIYVIAVTLNGE